MAIISLLEPGLVSFYIAITLVAWVSYARLVRSQVLVLKNSDFVIAARNLGYGHGRIMFRHILPNALVPSIVFSMSDVVLVILAGSAISYLGLGVQPPTAEWGVMISEGPELHLHRLVDDHFPGPCHRLPRSGLQPSCRRPRRETGRQGVMGDILQVEDLAVEVETPERRMRAVDGVTFSLGEGEVLGLVGESGSGKTLTCRAVIGLLPSRRLRIADGTIRLDGQDITRLSEDEMRGVRGARDRHDLPEPDLSPRPADDDRQPDR